LPGEDIPLGSRYLLHGLIGRGAMGEFWRGSARDGGPAVAIKILRPELVAQPAFVANFARQQPALLALSHPNLAAVRDVVMEGGTVALVTDLVAGDSLRVWLRRSGSLAPAAACRLVAQVAGALAQLHAAGIVYRDLQPENVLIEQPAPAGAGPGTAARAIVTGFGIAGLAGDWVGALDGPGEASPYVAPEVAQGGRPGPASDLYSLGIVLYELITGRPPVAGSSAEAYGGQPLSPPPRPDAVPEALWGCLRGLLAEDPGKRPPAAAQVAAALRALAGDLVGLAPLAPANPAEPAGDFPPGPPAGDSTPGPPAGDPPPGPLPPGPPAGGPLRLPPGVDFRVRPRNRRSLVRLGVALLVLALLVAGVGVAVHRLRAAAAPPAIAVLPFAPEVYPSGLVVLRTWQLTGSRGAELTGTLKVANAAPVPVSSTVVEVIPPAVAAGVGSISFDPAPATILAADPIVGYAVDLPPGGFTTFTYRVAVGGTARLGRLQAWAGDQRAARAAAGALAPEASLVSLAVSPTAVSLVPGEIAPLSVLGSMNTGAPAPASVLASAVWSSSRPQVVALSATALTAVAPGTAVTAVAPGTAVVTARIGSVSATAIVTVAPPPPGQPGRPSPSTPTRSPPRPAAPPRPPSTPRAPSVLATTTASSPRYLSETYSYTGSAQTFVVPAGVTSLQVVVAGAQGGAGFDYAAGTGGGGGRGAVVGVTLAVSPGETLTLLVGGEGGSGPAGSVAGFNGGGAGAYNPTPGFARAGGGGGGASDIRAGGAGLANRVVVAGGGGGGSLGTAAAGGRVAGGAGGFDGVPGESATSPLSKPGGGGGGTQSGGGAAGQPVELPGTPAVTPAGAGSLGQGGTGGYGPTAIGFNGGFAGGGGGGYYGGGGGAGGYSYNESGGGGGGSSFSSQPGAQVVAGRNAGNGFITLSWIQ
jgi:hypothetical protein